MGRLGLNLFFVRLPAHCFTDSIKDSLKIKPYLCALNAFRVKKALLYALSAAILWSVVTPFIKMGLSYDFSPLNFAGLRFTLVGILLLAYSGRKKMWAEVIAHKNLFLLLITINIFLGYATFYFGMNLVRADIASIVIGTNPLINVLMAHFIAKNDKLDAYKITSMIIALIGLLLIIGTGNNGSPLAWKAIAGVGLIIASIVLQAYATIRISEEKGEINPVFLNGVQMFFGGLMLYATGLLTEGYHPVTGKPFLFYLSLTVLVLVSTFAFSFWFIALRVKGAKVSDLNMTKLINPILGAILSWILLKDEYPTFATVSGMIIIVVSLLVYFKGRQLTKQIKRKHDR